MKIILEKKDIRSIKLEDFTFKDLAGYSAGMIFDVDDNYELTDEEDQIIIEIEGSYHNKGLHTGGRGYFYGELIIYKDDKIFNELEEGRLRADHIMLKCSIGGDSGSTFKVDTSLTLSENIDKLTSLEDSVFYGNYDCSAFDWVFFLRDHEDLVSKLKSEIKKIIPNKPIPENIRDLVDFLEEQGIIDNDKYSPCLDEKYDNTLGKIIMPYFKRDFDDYVFEDNDGRFSISGEPGDEDENEGVDINNAYIYVN